MFWEKIPEDTPIRHTDAHPDLPRRFTFNKDSLAQVFRSICRAIIADRKRLSDLEARLQRLEDKKGAE